MAVIGQVLINVLDKALARLDRQEDAESAEQKHALHHAGGAAHAQVKDALLVQLNHAD